MGLFIKTVNYQLMMYAIIMGFYLQIGLKDIHGALLAFILVAITLNSARCH